MKVKDLSLGFIKWYEDMNARPRTILERKRFLYGSILPAIGEKNIDELIRTDVSLVVNEAKKQGETGPQGAVVTLRNLLKYATDAGHNVSISWYDIPVPKCRTKVIEYLQPNEIRELRESFYLSDEEKSRIKKTAGVKGLRNAENSRLRLQTMIELILDTGLRISEVISLSIRDINWSNNELRVINCKTKDEEVVFPTDRSLSWVKTYLVSRNADGIDALFVSNGKRLPLNTAKRALYGHMKKHLPNFPKHVSFHIFRKTCTTVLLQEGLDIQSVKTLLRHKSERTTLKHYAAVCLQRAKVIQQRIMNAV